MGGLIPSRTRWLSSYVCGGLSWLLYFLGNVFQFWGQRRFTARHRHHLVTPAAPAINAATAVADFGLAPFVPSKQATSPGEKAVNTFLLRASEWPPLAFHPFRPAIPELGVLDVVGCLILGVASSQPNKKPNKTWLVNRCQRWSWFCIHSVFPLASVPAHLSLAERNSSHSVILTESATCCPQSRIYTKRMFSESHET